MSVGLSAIDSTEARAVAEVAQKAVTPQEVYRGERRVVVALNGKLHDVAIERPPIRQAKAQTVDAIVALAVNEQSTIWHRGDRVLLVIDDRPESYREDTVDWQLTQTDACAAAYKGLHGGDQKATVRYLTEALRKPVRECPDAMRLLAAVRKVNFKTIKDSSGSVSAVAEAVGRSVSAELVGAADLPEEFTIAVRRWAELDFTAMIEMAVTVDVANETFKIDPTRDELVSVERQAQQFLADYLVEKLHEAGKTGVPVFAGVP